jgi:hypothetical protein
VVNIRRLKTANIEMCLENESTTSLRNDGYRLPEYMVSPYTGLLFGSFHSDCLESFTSHIQPFLFTFHVTDSSGEIHPIFCFRNEETKKRANRIIAAFKRFPISKRYYRFSFPYLFSFF